MLNIGQTLRIAARTPTHSDGTPNKRDLNRQVPLRALKACTAYYRAANQGARIVMLVLVLD